MFVQFARPDEHGVHRLGLLAVHGEVEELPRPPLRGHVDERSLVVGVDAAEVVVVLALRRLGEGRLLWIKLSSSGVIGSGSA